MVDIKRKRRQSATDFGMTAPTDVTDVVARQLIQELQDNVETLAQTPTAGIVAEPAVSAETNVATEVNQNTRNIAVNSERINEIFWWLHAAFRIDTVAKLPAIPEFFKIVFWASSSFMTNGTGDNQLWTAAKGDSVWQPMSKFTNRSGVPD